VITDDEIMRLFELADPARDDDGVRMGDVAGYLDALQQRSDDMTLTEITEAPTKPPRDNRWLLATIVAAAIVLIVAGALLLTRDNDGEPVQIAPPTTVTPVAPTTAVEQTVEQTAGQSVDEAIALVRAFYDARNAYDADTALSYLSDEATVPTWSQGAALPHEIGSPEEFRLETASAAATNGKMLPGDCTTVEAQGPGITIRCGYDYQDLRSDELGIGPFGRNSTDVVVVDGKITSIAERGSATGFQEQMWDPFRAWLEAQHPDDLAVMDAADTPTEESIPLWEQRSREWVEARLAAEQVAMEFLQAFAAFDAEAAGAYLATGASTEHVINQAVADYRQAIALFQAWGYEQELSPCRQLGATATELHVRCPFTYHLLGSRELGLGPFDQNYFTVTVDASGMITEVNSSWRDADFGREVADPFATWVETTHPDALQLMAVDGSPALTTESLALWEQLRREYVQSVLDATPTTTAA
jgi:hypothetical protein